MSSTPNKSEVQVSEITTTQVCQRQDWVATEEPMEIRVIHGPRERRVLRSVSVTMRTPGHDHELALGFLFTEGILRSVDQVEHIESKGVTSTGESHGNICAVTLKPEVAIDWKGHQRNFLSSASCGVCGKASLESLERKGVMEIPSAGLQWEREILFQLPHRLRQQQALFHDTGGIHAAGIVDVAGAFAVVREDIGRHNAVDKVIGWWRQQFSKPISDRLLVVSGRAGFEIVQKAIVAGFPGMVAVGAPSSLAVELALRHKLMLVGFTSSTRFNVYSDPWSLLKV